MAGKDHGSPWVLIGISILIFVIAKLVWIDVLLVRGHSMEPTLQPGQYIIINRLAYGFLLPFTNEYLLYWGKPAGNYLVVFKNPQDGTPVVKRCIAGSGDHLRLENGYLYIGMDNNNRFYLGSPPLSGFNHTDSVPEDTILVLGDNRDNSVDSRLYGFVPKKSIVGKVIGTL